MGPVNLDSLHSFVSCKTRYVAPRSRCCIIDATIDIGVRVIKALKVVPEGCCRIFSGVKFKTVKLVGGRRFLAARSGLNVRRYLMVYMTLRLLYMVAQIIQMMAFTQIIAIWTPDITL